jgi:hypothetical protein
MFRSLALVGDARHRAGQRIVNADHPAGGDGDETTLLGKRRFREHEGHHHGRQGQ